MLGDTLHDSMTRRVLWHKPGYSWAGHPPVQLVCSQQDELTVNERIAFVLSQVDLNAL
jgi:hypothetical protein